MTINEISIYTGGILSLFMALFHTQFYRLFKWEKAFDKISRPNSLIIYTVHMALLLIFFLFAALSLFYANEMSRSTGLAFGLNLGYALFWIWRCAWQIFYFQTLKGRLHYILILYFFLLAVCYIIPVISTL
jgi:hypothetical protein